jgi:hypothetical protein
MTALIKWTPGKTRTTALLGIVTAWIIVVAVRGLSHPPCEDDDDSGDSAEDLGIQRTCALCFRLRHQLEEAVGQEFLPHASGETAKQC